MSLPQTTAFRYCIVSPLARRLRRAAKPLGVG